ncbi:MAG TPA: TonB family protein [Terriglobales bacterium]|nr:TonB family protein [Terriglobales bacterium]
MSASPQLVGSAARTHEQRLSPRKKVSKPLPIELLPGKEVWLENLCEGGLRVSGSSRLQPGTTTFLNFLLPSSNSPIEAAGVVAWSDTSGNVGVRFTRVKPDSTAALKRWLKNDSEPMSEVVSQSEPESVIAPDDALEQRIRALQQVSELQCEIAAQQLDAPAALDLVARRALQATRATGAAIALREGAEVICRASVGNAPEVGVKLTGSGLSGECLRTGVAISMSDSETDERVDREVCRTLQIRSLAVLPVLDEGNVEGIVEALSPEPNNFDAGDMLTLGLIAELVAGIRVSRAERETEEFDLDECIADFQAAAIEEEEENTPAPDAQNLSAVLATSLDEPLAPEAETSLSIGSVEELQTAAESVSTPTPTPAVVPAPKSIPAPLPKRPVIARPAVSVARPRSIPRRAWRMRYVAAAAVLVLGIIALGDYLGWHLTSRKASSGAPAPAYMAPANAQPATAVASTVSEPAAAEEASTHSSPRHAATAATKKEEVSEPDTETRTTNEVSVAVRQDKALAASRSGAQSDAAPAAPAITALSGYASAMPDIPSATPRVTVQSAAAVQPSVQEGKLIHRVMPVYPDFARRSGITGTVIISATVTKDGHLKNLKVVSGNALLAEEAVRAAREWRYTPYLLNGKPVEAETRIAMNFNP